MSKAKPKKPSDSAAPCAHCRPLHHALSDLSEDQDAQLELLATLMIGRRQGTDLDFRTAAEIGHAIDSYLQRKHVRESVFLDIPLKRCHLPAPDLKAELLRARAHRRDAEDSHG